MQDAGRVENASRIRLVEPEFEIYPAIYWRSDGKKIKAMVKNLPFNRYDFINGSLACWLSYLQAYEKFKNYDRLVILEDDAKINKDFDKNLHDNYIDNNYLDGPHSARLGKYMTGTIYTSSFYKDFLDSFSQTGITKPIDHYLIGFNKIYKYSNKPLMKDFSKQIVFYDKIYKRSNINEKGVKKPGNRESL